MQEPEIMMLITFYMAPILIQDKTQTRVQQKILLQRQELRGLVQGERYREN